MNYKLKATSSLYRQRFCLEKLHRIPVDIKGRAVSTKLSLEENLQIKL